MVVDQWLTRPKMDVKRTLEASGLCNQYHEGTYDLQCKCTDPKRDEGLQSKNKLPDKLLQENVSLQMLNIHLESCVLTLIMVLNRVITYLGRNFLPY